ncbi:MAG: SdpI family protein [Oscillospiraceae bacterium]|nr:SdpI family protein [Oscillospiraceae bacterium]
MFKFIVFFSEQIFVPVTMIVLGLLLIKRTPTAESGLGYRTRRSLSSERAWLAAHYALGGFWLVSGIFTLAAAAVITACLGSSGFAFDNSADKYIYVQWAVQYALCAGAFPVTELCLGKMMKAETVG